MKTYEGHIKYNEEKHRYGIVDYEGNWIKEELEDGDRIDIVINGEIFSTNYKVDHDTASLRPHSWYNWDAITKEIAIYYDFEKLGTSAKKQKKPKTDLTNHVAAFYHIGIVFSISVILCVLLTGGSNDRNWATLPKQIMICVCFFGGNILGAIIMLTNILPQELCLSFGSGLYYGTVLLGLGISDFIDNYAIGFAVSFLVCLSVCYIVWIKKFKSQYTE